MDVESLDIIVQDVTSEGTQENGRQEIKLESKQGVDKATINFPTASMGKSDKNQSAMAINEIPDTHTSVADDVSEVMRGEGSASKQGV